jgi:hypothetical protein
MTEVEGLLDDDELDAAWGAVEDEPEPVALPTREAGDLRPATKQEMDEFAAFLAGAPVSALGRLGDSDELMDAHLARWDAGDREFPDGEGEAVEEFRDWTAITDDGEFDAASEKAGAEPVVTSLWSGQEEKE